MANMKGFNPYTGEWNDSLIGEFLWSSTNIGETLSDVLTPFTWSLISANFEQMNVMPEYPLVGNIGGRGYNNNSVLATVLRAMGRNIDDLLKEMGGLSDEYKDNLPKIILPLPKPAFLPLLIRGIKIRKKQSEGVNNISTFLSENPAWCRRMFERISKTSMKSELADLASEETIPYSQQSFWIVIGSAWDYGEYVGKLRRELVELVGPDDADKLFSSVSNEVELLASLGPIVGLTQLERGEINQADYLERWGHRGPHESEVSTPRPAEDPGWLEQQLAVLRQSPVDVDTLLLQRRVEFQAALKRFQDRYPHRAESLQKRLEIVAQKARAREAVRSELVRVVWVARAWGLQAGKLTGLNEDIFFLTIDETISLLRDEDVLVETISARKETFRRYQALPPYPLVIRGHFDPFQWASDPNQRTDFAETDGVMARIIADTNRDHPERTTVIYGASGSAGVAEGYVRRLDSPEDGDKLKPGEILVTTQTNIGWSYLFPLTKAIVTDVGAALSHAAIVARELGIPAVVNCGNATMRLNTGDRIRVDGSAGTVTILSGKS